MVGRFFSTYKNSGFVLLAAAICFSLCSPVPCRGDGRISSFSRYVGSNACKPCHEKEYSSFTKYAKKSTSYRSIERLKKGLSTQDLNKCYGCHTTGYGKPGGFVSLKQTPELKNAGCEVCHGPGGRHVITGDPDRIKKKPTRKDCESCHTPERIRAFRYTPLIHGGGH